MKKKQVELTQEQCDEIIEKMTARSFYKSGTGKVHNADELQTEEPVGSSIDDILPEPLPSVAKQAQTEAASSVAEVVQRFHLLLMPRINHQSPPFNAG